MPSRPIRSGVAVLTLALVLPAIVAISPARAVGIDPFAETKITPSEPAGSAFGHWVAAWESRILATDAAGSAYVLHPDGDGGYTHDRLGSSGPRDGSYRATSMAASGGRILVGAPFEGLGDYERPGAAYLYEPDGSGGFTQTEVVASDLFEDEEFGGAVAISGDSFVVGADRDFENGVLAGSAYVYDIDGAGGLTETKLLASDGADFDAFGESVAMSGKRVVVGAPTLGSNFAHRSGKVYLYDAVDRGGFVESKLEPSDGVGDDLFGKAVALTEDRMVVGAPGSDSAYLYEPDGSGGYRETKLVPNDDVDDSSFGQAVAIRGDRIVVGAWRDDERGPWSGSVHVFELDGVGGYTAHRLLASDGEDSDRMGYSVALVGDAVVAGAPFDRQFGGRHGAIYQFAPDSDEPTCGGLTSAEADAVGYVVTDLSEATSPQVAVGTDAADWILGSSRRDNLRGGSGDDLICGGGGNDFLWGNAGNDRLDGGRGDDRLGGNRGNDTIIGGPGNDRLLGSSGVDTITAGAGLDVAYGGGGDDVIDGGAGDDRLSGNRGDDAIDGGRGADTIVGGTGRDDCFRDDTGDRSVVCGGDFVETKVTSPTSGQNSDFGTAVAMSGDVMAVGAPVAFDDGREPHAAPGSVHLFRPDETGALVETTLRPSDSAENDHFGRSIAMAGETIAVGASNGHAYVFTPDGVGAYAETKLEPSTDVGFDFGWVVAVSGDTIAVSAPSRGSGQVYVFEPDGAGGYTETELPAPNDGVVPRFGESVAISGRTVLVGAPDYDGPGDAYVFELDGEGGYTHTRLSASDREFRADFGSAVAILDGTMVVGAKFNGNSFGQRFASGAVYVYEPDGLGGFTETKLFSSRASAYAHLGTSVAASGNRIVAGAPADNEADSGAIYVWERDVTGVFAGTRVVASDGARHDRFGFAVAVAGDRVVAGAFGDDDRGPSAGAAYVYEMPPA